MRRLIAAGIAGLTVAIIVACASGQTDIVTGYAACMADQSRPLYALAAPGFGGDFTVEDALTKLRMEMQSGETTIEEIRGAYAIFCDGD